jgi:hypothetical protein
LAPEGDSARKIEENFNAEKMFLENMKSTVNAYHEDRNSIKLRKFSLPHFDFKLIHLFFHVNGSNTTTVWRKRKISNQNVLEPGRLYPMSGF